MRRCQILFLFLFLCLMLQGQGFSRGLDIENKNITLQDPKPVVIPEDLRHVAVHDAGKLYSSFYDGFYSIGYASGSIIDPETDLVANETSYPNGSDINYLFFGGIWVGGIVNGDTLVSTISDGWAGALEMQPHDPDAGGIYRTGDFSDDEFVTIVTDTFPADFHVPMNLNVTQKSYSWADPMYDDFTIVEYTVHNFGAEDITDGWAGVLLDPDVYHSSEFSGYSDDCSGLLDTLLEAGNPSSRALIGYSFDNDGNPLEDGSYLWVDESPRGAISLQFLGGDFTPDYINFNWWISNGNPSLDFGPRREGTPEDPFFEFSEGVLGTPVQDKDKYYVLSHPEIDYDQIFAAVDHTADGWLAPDQSQIAIDFADGYDTRFMMSFGPFDLPVGASVSFTVALVAGDNVHVNGSDFHDYFDAMAPDAFYNTLDFTELILHNKRALDVYESGFALPIPGPPVGLEVTSFDDTFVDLAWHPTNRLDLAGYNIYFRDTEGDNIWYKSNLSPVTDTFFTVSITNPTHRHEFAATIVDNTVRESGYSSIVDIIPNTPHTVVGVESILQDLNVAVQWDWNIDTDIEYYIIYRSIWDEEFEKLDSTTNDYYVDVTTESGVKYNYYVTAVNIYGNESVPSETTSQIPMAFDQGILFIDASRAFDGSSVGFYFDIDKFESLVDRVASRLPVTKHIVNDMDVGFTPVTFNELSNYSHIVVFLESRVGGAISSHDPLWYEDMALYMQLGGSCVFSTVSADFSPLALYVSPFEAQTRIFSPGDPLYDIFKLDSIVQNTGGFSAGIGINGDLVSSAPLHPDYSQLDTDTISLQQWGIFPSYLPGCGYMFPRPEAEPIYSYVSSVPDTINHGQINGIRYLGEDYQFVLFNFPLTVMEGDTNYEMLLQALNDLGVNIHCGDTNDDGATNIGDAVYLIQYIFMGGDPPADMGHADINCDGNVNMGDAVGLINYVFRDNALLRCCP